MKMKLLENKFEPLDAQCKGCACSDREKDICKIYLKPMAWFRAGGYCPMATHLSRGKETPLVAQQRRRVGQQKQRKKRF